MSDSCSHPDRIAYRVDTKRYPLNIPKILYYAPPSLISPSPPFQRRKVNKPPLPLPSIPIQSQTINMYLSWQDSISCRHKALSVEHNENSLLRPPLSNKPPPLFRGGKLISPPPLPLPSIPIQSQTINMYLSVMVYSGWKFILFWVFGRMTSNFMCLTFSTLLALVLCGELLPFPYC